MARKPTFVKEPRIEQYALKQSLIREAYGYLPEELRRQAQAQIARQLQDFNTGFGALHSAWLTAVGILQARDVSHLDYAKYKAFVNEYVSKVRTKKTETVEMVIAKYTALGASEPILRDIIGALGEVTTMP